MILNDFIDRMKPNMPLGFSTSTLHSVRSLAVADGSTDAPMGRLSPSPSRQFYIIFEAETPVCLAHPRHLYRRIADECIGCQLATCNAIFINRLFALPSIDQPPPNCFRYRFGSIGGADLLYCGLHIGVHCIDLITALCRYPLAGQAVTCQSQANQFAG